MIKSYTKIGTAKLTSISGDIKDIVRNGDDSALTPDDSCYAPYGGNYTYIVVEVYYQGKTVPVYTMIKVKAADPLFDLTDNTIDVPAFGLGLVDIENVTRLCGKLRVYAKQPVSIRDILVHSGFANAKLLCSLTHRGIVFNYVVGDFHRPCLNI